MRDRCCCCCCFCALAAFSCCCFSLRIKSKELTFCNCCFELAFSLYFCVSPLLTFSLLAGCCWASFWLWLWNSCRLLAETAIPFVAAVVVGVANAAAAAAAAAAVAADIVAVVLLPAATLSCLLLLLIMLPLRLALLLLLHMLLATRLPHPAPPAPAFPLRLFNLTPSKSPIDLCLCRRDATRCCSFLQLLFICIVGDVGAPFSMPFGLCWPEHLRRRDVDSSPDRRSFTHFFKRFTNGIIIKKELEFFPNLAFDMASFLLTGNASMRNQSQHLISLRVRGANCVPNGILRTIYNRVN